MVVDNPDVVDFAAGREELAELVLVHGVGQSFDEHGGAVFRHTAVLI